MKKFLALALMLTIVCSLFAVLPTSAATKETELNLDWQLGLLYDSDEPQPHDKRKYAVISDLKEGDVITIEPGTWGGWAYPADGGKALASDIYYEIKYGEKFTYTVGPETNGKVPTQFRLCIYNADKAIIDDAVWSTFDMKITLKTEEEAPPAPTFEGTVVDNLTWKNGTYYNTTPGNGNGKYIYTVIELKKGDKIQFEIPGVWNLWVYPAVNGVATGDYRGGNGDKKIGNGEIMTFADNITELRVTAYIEGGASATVEDDAFKTLDLKFHKISAAPEVKPPHTADGVALASMIGALAALAVVTGVIVLRNKRVFAGK